MGSDLEGRTALVTGGSGGIGRALCRRLAGAGAAVAVHYSGSADAAAEVVAAIEADGGRAAGFQADLRSADAPARLLGEVGERLGPVEVLVVNHGMADRTPWEEIDVATWDATLETNLRPAFFLARDAALSMRERGFGRILLMSSVAATTGGVIGPHYSASKAAMHGFAHFLAGRLAPDGVCVNVLAPALVEGTGMVPEATEALVANIPLGRLGQPDEVADMALAILGNAYMTNQVVEVNGGMHPT